MRWICVMEPTSRKPDPDEVENEEGARTMKDPSRTSGQEAKAGRRKRMNSLAIFAHVFFGIYVGDFRRGAIGKNAFTSGS